MNKDAVVEMQCVMIDGVETYEPVFYNFSELLTELISTYGGICRTQDPNQAYFSGAPQVIFSLGIIQSGRVDLLLDIQTHIKYAESKQQQNTPKPQEEDDETEQSQNSEERAETELSPNESNGEQTTSENPQG